MLNLKNFFAKLYSLYKKFNFILFFKNNFILITILYLTTLLIFGRYFNMITYIIFSFYTFFLVEHPTLITFLNNVKESKKNLLYHYTNKAEEPLLYSIYIVVNTIYVFAMINFIFLQPIPIIRQNVGTVLIIALLAIILDFITRCYIINFKNRPATYLSIGFDLIPKAFVICGTGYYTFAITNPTAIPSHPFHLYGPTNLGALGATPNTPEELGYLYAAMTVHCHDQPKTMKPFLYKNVPDLATIKFRIHSSDDEYGKWRVFLPCHCFETYGLDKPRGVAVYNDGTLLKALKERKLVSQETTLLTFKTILNCKN